MDPRINPYSPGAGTPPPELAGRDQLIEDAAIAIDRIRAGRPAKSFVFYGLRGVGKTVLLNRIRLDAEARGIISVQIEAPEGRSLPASLAPALRAALFRLSRGAAMKDSAKRAFSALAGFVRTLKIKYSDIEISMAEPPEAGLADSGDLIADLNELFDTVALAARDANTAVVLYIDELQYVEEEQLAALISALHSTSSQKQLPLTMVGAGLPQILSQLGEAKSYAERLFQFKEIARLDPPAADAALTVPAQRENVMYSQDAVTEVLTQTDRYPYFLQEWGKHCWDIATVSPIDLTCARAATARALNELDASFFRVRFDRLTPGEKLYMRAMAELGPGPHRSGDIAAKLNKPVASAAPTRASLISKGMVYSPDHGDTAFTVPLFDDFMRRTIPQFP